MCNLYSMTTNRQAVLRLFRVGDNRAAAFEPRDAIFPGHSAPVVRQAADGARELLQMSWGFVLPQPGRAPRRVTNFRDDKTRGSPFWRESFELRRCLVPATAFAEPREVKPATWHWFALALDARLRHDPDARLRHDPGDEPRPPFAFAGIWRRWQGPLKKDGPVVEVDVFSFMTTTPNALVATINHERMPVLLADEAAFRTWLEGTPAEAFALARQHPPEAMRIVQAGLEKRDLLAPG